MVDAVRALAQEVQRAALDQLSLLPVVGGWDATSKVYLLCAVLLVAAWCAYHAYVHLRGPSMGYGSGSNGNWSRKINFNRPQFTAGRHHKLADVWVYTGAATTADLDFVRTHELSTVSAKDPVSGCPLSGHLVGRQTWQRVAKPTAAQKSAQDALTFDPSRNSNAGDKLLRAQLLAANGGDPAQAQPGSSRGTAAAASLTPEHVLTLGWDFFAKLQCEDGHWGGDYGGPLFLLPGMILACYVSGYDLATRLSAMVTYMSNHQQADGGWGLHIEGPSSVFSTTMNYMALRVAGLGPEDGRVAAARAFLHHHGGATFNPHWGKFWMAVMGAFDWEGVNPIPPELWILPRWFPFHPGKMWCHSRMPYLSMCYLYGTKGGLHHGHPMATALRAELYPPGCPYESVVWDDVRNTVAEIDLYAPHTWIMDVAMWGLRQYETYCPRWIFSRIRGAGLAFVARYVHSEDVHTNYIDIGPCNKVTNMLTVFYSKGRESEEFRRHCARVDDYLWVAEDGMKMQGYNGSQLWDTAFAAQAIATAGPEVAGRYKSMLTRMAAFIDASQIKEDVPMRTEFFRTVSKGGWPFSTNDHGWPIADCTAEGMRGALLLRSLAAMGVFDMGQGYSDGMGVAKGGHISPERFADAVNVILAFHNPDGGWATYEETRGGSWYEYLNPAEVWGDLMIDYTYTELTSDCVQALAMFAKHFPHVRTRDVRRAMDRGVDFVRVQQRPDGSWYGSWAVCFTYGCWFGSKAIVAGGDPGGRDKAALERMCAYLLSKQREDGGWGESYVSCLVKEYSSVDSTAVNTAWALLSLINAQCTDSASVERGVRFLMAHQQPNGDWAQEWCSGIFNRTCAITYTAYRNVFPLWALAAYVKEYKHRRSGGGAGAGGQGAVADALPVPPLDFGLPHSGVGAAVYLAASSAGAASTPSSAGVRRRSTTGASPRRASVQGSGKRRAGSSSRTRS